MEPKDYIIVGINGDYAMVRELDRPEETSFPVAMVLLPPGVDLGRCLRLRQTEIYMEITARSK